MSDRASTACLIVDDEPLARSRLRALAREVSWLECVGEAANGRAAIGAIEELEPDLVFLDIRLPDLSGVDVVGRLSRAPAVIFTTAYDRFAVTAFELGAIDYLLKPFGRERFLRAMERARPFLERQAGASGAARAREALATGPASRIFARDGGRIVPVPVASIERLEACDDYVLVHSGGKRYRVNLQLSDLETRLDAAVFVRIHRSHIVNFDHVASLAPYDGSRFHVTLRSGVTIVASRQRSRALRDLVTPGPPP
jgi:two-component system LytT family response regulator